MNYTKYISLFLFLISISHFSKAQSTYEKEIKEYQEALNEEYRNPEETSLSVKDLKKFKKHKFFPIDPSYKVEAQLTRMEKPQLFRMKTSSARMADYKIYAIAEFELNGKKYALNIYQSQQLLDSEEYKDYLFLPFTDQTNGKDSYGGGRYIGLSIPQGNKIIIDFNKAYNPYCAYSDKYSYPIPPRENDLNVRVEAGIKLK